MAPAPESALDRIVIRGSADVDFDYTVSGVRRSFTDFTPLHDNVTFVPASVGASAELTIGLPAESVRRLISNGTLNADGSVNAQTARRLGWDRRPDWNNPAARPESLTQPPPNASAVAQ